MSATSGPFTVQDLHENCAAIIGDVPVSASCPTDQRRYFQRIGIVSQRDPHPVYGGGISHATMLANAKLWAAAPRLLSALEAIIENDGSRGTFDAFKLADARIEASAAIAEARSK